MKSDFIQKFVNSCRKGTVNIYSNDKRSKKTAELLNTKKDELSAIQDEISICNKILERIKNDEERISNDEIEFSKLKTVTEQAEERISKKIQEMKFESQLLENEISVLQEKIESLINKK